ncbi:MAG: hypothetical protein ACC707_09010 [Thiohalomonadales bacterium]
MQSLLAVGISGKSILILSLVVGGILAVFSMFIAEFLGKVKEKMADNRQLESIN